MGRHRVSAVQAALVIVAACFQLGCTELGDTALYEEIPVEGCAEPEPIPDAVATIFETSCAGSSCHTNGGASGGLALDREGATAALVGVNNSAGNTQRVAPGDPDSSYLIQKVRGESSAGSPMPLGTSGLEGEDLK
ncbi:MAG: hypothetical protein ACI9WU_004715, partial [Myxococcota bacterium]